MIVVAGLTPAWQQIMRFDSLALGEVNRANEACWCASGKVLNVGIALAHLGAAAETISPVGGLAGERIRAEFASLAIPAHWIETRHPTRVCTTLLNARPSQTTELVENAGPMTPEELERYCGAYVDRAARATFAVLTGSLPAGVPPTLFRDLLGQTPCPALLDIRGEELLAALASRPFLVKPNSEELARTVGRDLSTEPRLREAMHELNDRGAQWVVVTQGGAHLWASCGGQIWRIAPPKLEVVNPIGSGDCLAAGLAWALSDGADPLEALRLAVAAAAENVTHLLPARLNPEIVRARAATILVEPR